MIVGVTSTAHHYAVTWDGPAVRVVVADAGGRLVLDLSYTLAPGWAALVAFDIRLAGCGRPGVLAVPPGWGGVGP